MNFNSQSDAICFVTTFYIAHTIIKDWILILDKHFIYHENNVMLILLHLMHKQAFDITRGYLKEPPTVWHPFAGAEERSPEKCQIVHLDQGNDWLLLKSSIGDGSWSGSVKEDKR